MVNKGFTLLEVLVTTTLAAALMVAILSVSTALTSTRRVMEQEAARQDQPLWQRQLVERLRWDLAQAISLHREQDQLIMVGYGGLDPTDLHPLHRPVEITYRLVNVASGNTPGRTVSGGGISGVISGGEAGQRWLVRQQKYLDQTSPSDSPPPVTTELVCTGLEHFALTTDPLPLPAEGDAETMPTTGNNVSGQGAVPPYLRLVVARTNSPIASAVPGSLGNASSTYREVSSSVCEGGVILNP